MKRIRILLPEKFFRGIGCFQLRNCIETPRGLVLFYPMITVEVLKSDTISLPEPMEIESSVLERIRLRCRLEAIAKKAIIISVPIEDGDYKADYVICLTELFFLFYVYRWV